MIKRFVPIFVFLIFVFSFTATYSYALDNGISDKAEILSPSDETQINAAIAEFKKTCGAEVNAGAIRVLGSIPGLGRSPGGGHGNLL